MMKRQRAFPFHFPGCGIAGRWRHCSQWPELLQRNNRLARGAGSQSLPDSPQAKQQPTANAPEEEAGKFVGYMTKRSLFFPDIAASPHPLSVGGKFELFVNESISPETILISAFGGGLRAVAGYRRLAMDKGPRATASDSGASMATGASSSFFGTFLGASVATSGSAFFPQTHPTFWGSIKYSARRLVVTRSDSGKRCVSTHLV